MACDVSLAGSMGSGVPKVLARGRYRGRSCCPRLHDEFGDGPLRNASCAVISGAALWVGPIMGLPSSFAGALAPSGNSFAVT